jgi:exopolysaccharide biosynthesis WecB/TagA/CpsF family protein
MLTEIKPKLNPLFPPRTGNEDFHLLSEAIIKKISILNSFEEAFSIIEEARKKKKRPIVVSFINAHGYNLCLSNLSFYNCLMNSDFVFRDGIGIKILLKMLGKKAGKNLNGTDFIPFLLEQFKNQKIALIGTKKIFLDVAINHQSIIGHQVIMREDGFLPFDEYLEAVAKAKPQLVLLGMGMPKQEELAILLKRHLNGSNVIINGGGVLDFMGKKVPRAPLLIRKFGLEWFFRFIYEPRRLFKRYIIGNFVFISHIVRLCAWYK